MDLGQLGRRIRTLRTKKGLSQEKLAEGAGLNGKYIGEVERGMANISIQNVDKLACVLGVPLLELLTMEHEITRERIVKDIYKMLDEGTEEQLKTIYRILSSIIR